MTTKQENTGQNADSLHELEAPLDGAVRAARQQSIDPQTLRQAADRVWARLAEEARKPTAVSAAETDGSIVGCSGYQSLIPEYLAGDLSPERSMLLEDHSRECVPCRRALTAARSRSTEEAIPAAATLAKSPSRTSRWLAVAAVAVVAVGLFAFMAASGWLGAAPVTVAALDGNLQRLDDGAGGTLAAGAHFKPGEAVRTGRDSTALLRLDDGSTLELGERTQVTVRNGWRGTTVHLGRGSLIVEAADQRPRHLFVATDDCLVSVTGTVFSVDNGLMGSRVAVVEGEVRVAQQKGETVLGPGDQVTTRNGLATLPVEEQIAWSRNVDRYLAMMGELRALKSEIDARVPDLPARGAGRLLETVPAGTTAYFALPNFSESLSESYAVLKDRLTDSPVLADWWSRHMAEGEGEMDRMIDSIRDFGSFLGDELIVTLANDRNTEGGAVALLMAAEVVGAGFEAHLDEVARQLAEEAGYEVLRPFDPAVIGTPAGGDHLGLWAWYGDGLFLVSPDLEALDRGVATIEGQRRTFAGSRLEGRILDAYRDGVEWLFAGDLSSLMAESDGERNDLTALDQLDIAVVEHHSGAERSVTRADLSFAGARSGMWAWLAPPAPMGSLDLISPDASLAVALIVKEPSAMLEDLLLTGEADLDALTRAEDEVGVDLRNDLLPALGGEVAFALDGPILPIPAWKLIVEVDDPVALQSGIETLVRRTADERGGTGPTLEQEEANGRTYYRVVGEGPLAIHYTYAAGYLVAGPDRSALERTFDLARAGASLSGSATFLGLLPPEGSADVSGIFYQHLGPVVAPVVGELGRLTGEGQLTGDQARAFQQLARDSHPMLAYAVGEEDRIRVVGSHWGGTMGLGVQTFLGLGGLADLFEDSSYR
ncbi:MAG: FecR domain-containing protein [Acidobacteriota bacterium]